MDSNQFPLWYDSWNIPEPYVAEAREKFGTLGQLIVHGHDVFDRALEEFRTLIHLYAAQSKRHGEVMNPPTILLCKLTILKLF